MNFVCVYKYHNEYVSTWPTNMLLISFVVISGVATGWHGWTMPRGPGAKGAPEKDKKKKREEKKKKRNEKRERNFSNTQTGAPTRYIPMSLSRCQDNTKIKHWLSSQDLWNMRRKMGNWDLLYFFKLLCHLKFGAHKFERVQWSRTKLFENNSWSRVPNFPIRSSGAQISPLLGSLICPLLYQRPPMFHCAIEGPFSRFPHQVI